MDLLDATTVSGWLADRGHPDGEWVEPLAGGVSSAVFGVGEGFVVKQARPRLAVADEWLADPRRVLHEAYALRLAATLTPDAVPRVVDVDPDRLVVLLERAPLTWVDWRSRLLELGADAEVDAAVAARLGTVLGTWHAASAPRAAELAADLAGGATSFAELRLEPFHHTVARRVPEVAAAVRAAAARLVEPALPVLVHGDFSPKNVLVDPDRPGRLWVIDFEVAHVGAAVFDLAFLLGHLICKSAHRPADAAALGHCGQAFLAAYAAAVPAPMRPVWSAVAPQVACILLARVHGKSPAGYLTPQQAAAVDATARRLLREPGDDHGAAWAYLSESRSGVR